MQRLTLRPIPPIQLGLPYNGSWRSPVYWDRGWVDVPGEHTSRRWPQAVNQWWRPSYWLLRYRVWRDGFAPVPLINPLDGVRFVAVVDDAPVFGSVDEMRDYWRRVNQSEGLW